VIKFSPETRKRLRRFRAIKRGYYSFVIFTLLVLLALVAELFINNRALYVSYDGRHYFPTYGDIIPGRVFGLDYDYETNYRELAQKFVAEENGGRVIMPLVPYSAFEAQLRRGATRRTHPPAPTATTWEPTASAATSWRV